MGWWVIDPEGRTVPDVCIAGPFTCEAFAEAYIRDECDPALFVIAFYEADGERRIMRHMAESALMVETLRTGLSTPTRGERHAI